MAAKTAPAARPQTKRILFDLTNDQGWHYSGSLPLPTGHLSFSKDISSSPPGMTKVSATLTSSPEVQATIFSDDNPGRPNGPQLTVDPGVLAFKSSGKVIRKLQNDMIDGSGTAGGISYAIGSCGLFDPYQGYFPYKHEVTCKPESGSGEEQFDVPEADVPALDATVRGERPAYVINLDPNSASCNAIIYASGTVELAPDFSANGCGQLKLSIIG